MLCRGARRGLAEWLRSLIPQAGLSEVDARAALALLPGADLAPPETVPDHEIRMLGILHARARGAAVFEGAGRRKSDELLAFLVLQRGAPLSRDRIAAALWPGDDQGRTTSRFHVAMHRLRRDVAGVPWLSLRRSDAGYSVQLPRGCRIDALEFEELAGLTTRALHEGRSDDATTLARRALALCAGPFLAGCHSEWVRSRRERIDRIACDLARELGRLELQAGRREEARRAAEFVLARDQSDETAKRVLVDATGPRYRSGRSDDAATSH